MGIYIGLWWSAIHFLDPECVERIRYARSFSCIRKIETITNCINLHRVGAEELLTSGLDVITVSTTGFDVGMYQRIYRNGHYEQMKGNLLTLLRTNHALEKPVKINIELRIDKPIRDVLNCSDFKEVMELADAVDANYYFDNWSGRIKTQDLPGNMKIRPNAFFPMKGRIPCAQLWVGVGVLVDGTVTACSCRDLNGDSDLVLGSINEGSLAELYRSERLRGIREHWFSGRKIPPLCIDCGAYVPYSHLMLAKEREEHFGQSHGD